MIEINHLTTKQMILLKRIWSCDTTQELQDFQMALEPEDLVLSVSLIELLKVESLDLVQAETGDLDLARECLAKILN